MIYPFSEVTFDLDVREAIKRKDVDNLIRAVVVSGEVIENMRQELEAAHAAGYDEGREDGVEDGYASGWAAARELER